MYPKYHNIQSFSDQQQDLFIISCTRGKKYGSYLEIGAGHPVYGNNTFALETQFGWRGVSFEMNPELVNEFNLIRRNACIIGDATKINYTELMDRSNVGNHWDLLQVDLNPPEATYQALKQINFDKYSFSIVTFEHDSYNYPNLPGNLEYVKTESRELLQKHGYTRVISDVIHAAPNPHSGLPHGPLEDWYVHEELIGNDTWKRFVGEGVAMDPGYCSQDTMKLFDELLKGLV